MKIFVINGTNVKGCTYKIKECFLGEIRSDNEVKEIYLPIDMPKFCTGCKNCFFKGEAKCPNAEYTESIWDEILKADLIVFAYPVYALRAPAAIKTLLDHFCVHWMVHRPKKAMFNKRVAIITNSIGAPNGAAQKDVATSAMWMGVSDIKRLGFGLMEDVYWDGISKKRRGIFEKQARAFARKCAKPIKKKKSLKVNFFLFICRIMHKSAYKKELEKGEILLDNRYWVDNNWFK